MEKCRVCGFPNALPWTAALFDTGPFYPARRVLDEDPICPTRDINKNVTGSAKYVQGRTTTKKLGVMCPISLFILVHFPTADGQGNDSGGGRS